VSSFVCAKCSAQYPCTEDELVVGADLLFLEGEEVFASGIGIRMVLGMTSNM
jgi:hypothetical protein